MNMIFFKAVVFLFIILILLIIICVAAAIVKKIKTEVFIYKNIFLNRIDQIYYFASRNYQLLSNSNLNTNKPHYDFDYSWCDNNTIICHALGEIDNVLFTECKEAFEKHYAQGCRVFELDLSLTSDNVPVVIHDWNKFNFGKMSGDKSAHKDRSMTYEEFKGTKVLGKYTTLTMERFVELADKYKDAYFIISAKSRDQGYDDTVDKIFTELFRKTNEVDPHIAKRYILHAYSFDFLERAMEKFTFHSAIYRCVQHPHPLILADELKSYGIKAVTILNIVYSPGQCEVFHNNGIKIIGCVVSKKIGDDRIKYWNKCKADILMTPLGGKLNEKV